jgi:hypothetical protein
MALKVQAGQGDGERGFLSAVASAGPATGRGLTLGVRPRAGISESLDAGFKGREKSQVWNAWKARVKREK